MSAKDRNDREAAGRVDQEEVQRRTVWKPVLSDPFIHSWPELKDDHKEQILGTLINLLRPLKTKPSGPDSSNSQPDEVEEVKGPAEDDGGKIGEGRGSRVPEIEECLKKKGKNQQKKPRIPTNAYVGINKLTRTLEKELCLRRQVGPREVLEAGQGLSGSRPDGIGLVFVCLKDLKPMSLLDHLLGTIKTVNRLRALSDDVNLRGSLIYVVGLPRGSEERLAELMGIRTVAALGLNQLTPETLSLRGLVEASYKELDLMFAPLELSSLHSTNRSSLDKQERAELRTKHILTHIKHYKTSAPLKAKNKAGKLDNNPCKRLRA